MAFCTGCGRTLAQDAKFCANCGTRVPAASAGSPVPRAAENVPAAPSSANVAAAPAVATYAAQPAPVPALGGSALKVILVIVGVLVLVIVVALGGLVYLGYKAKKAITASESGTGSSVTTPFGKVIGGNQGGAFKVAKELGIDVYPGATATSGSAGAVSFGGYTVGGAEFETSDPLEKVGTFYRGRYPNSSINVADQDSQTIMLNDPKGTLIIALKWDGDRTKINISQMGARRPE